MFRLMVKFVKEYRYDIVIYGIVILLTFLAFWNRDAFSFFGSPQELRDYLTSFGIFAPLMIVLGVILEVIVAPIPPFIPIIAAGFLFGPILGGFYVYLGNIIGTLIVFFLARRFGRAIIFKLFNKDKLIKYEESISRHENILLAFYFFPIFPLDVISAAFGLSLVRVKKFVSLMIIGYAFNISLLVLFGDYLVKFFF